MADAEWQHVADALRAPMAAVRPRARRVFADLAAHATSAQPGEPEDSRALHGLVCSAAAFGLRVAATAEDSPHRDALRRLLGQHADPDAAAASAAAKQPPPSAAPSRACTAADRRLLAQATDGAGLARCPSVLFAAH